MQLYLSFFVSFVGIHLGLQAPVSGQSPGGAVGYAFCPVHVHFPAYSGEETICSVSQSHHVQTVLDFLFR